MSHGTNGSGALWGKAGVTKSVAKKDAPTIVVAPRILVVILPVITIILLRQAWCRQQSEAEISALSFSAPVRQHATTRSTFVPWESNAVEASTSNKHR
jgi:hypothetical protein